MGMGMGGGAPPPPYGASGQGAAPSGYGSAYSSAYGGYSGTGGVGPAPVAAAGGGSRRGSVADDSKTGGKDALLNLSRWFKQRSPKERMALLGVAGVVTLLILWLTIEDHDTLFVLAEAAHFLGIGLLGYKISAKKSVAGLSLQSQLLTAAFLAVRLFCSVMMEYDIHTLLDGLTLLATLGVLGAMLYPSSPVRQTYQPDLDSVRWWVVAAPCALLALLAHPQTTHFLPFRVMWAACVYLEAVSVLPQLRMMQNAKVVERFTAHYVFALGLSRFFSCAHWVLQLLEGNRYLYSALGSGLWPIMVLLSEVVQTFILGDFCYYYLRAYSDGTGIVRLPVGIV